MAAASSDRGARLATASPTPALGAERQVVRGDVDPTVERELTGRGVA